MKRDSKLTKFCVLGLAAGVPLYAYCATPAPFRPAPQLGVPARAAAAPMFGAAPPLSLAAHPRSLEELRQRFAQLKLQGFRTMALQRSLPTVHPRLTSASLTAIHSNAHLGGPATIQSANMASGPASGIARASAVARPAIYGPCANVVGWEVTAVNGQPPSSVTLSPGITYTLTGCNLASPDLKQGQLGLVLISSYPTLRQVGLSQWTDDKIVFSVPVTLSTGQPDTQANLVVRGSSAGQGHDVSFISNPFSAQRGAPITLSRVPTNGINLTAAGSPFVSSPMTNFYGLNASIGVARLSLGNGILAGQDTMEFVLPAGFVVTGTQIQYLVYSGSGATSVVNGTPTQAPTVIQNPIFGAPTDVKILVNWPISSVIPNGQSKPVYYSVYGLNVIVQGPNGMNPQ